MPTRVGVGMCVTEKSLDSSHAHARAWAWHPATISSQSKRMQHTLIVMAALVGLLGSFAQGGNLYSYSEPVSFSYPDYRMITLSYETVGDEVFRGFDATFTGEMWQNTPFGLSTIFADNNILVYTSDAIINRDSQFLFNSREVVSAGVAESNTLLTGRISGLEALNRPNPFPFAVIVTNNPADVAINLQIDNGQGGLDFGGSLDDVTDCLTCIPYSVFGDVQVSITSVPAEGLPGHRTYTAMLSLQTTSPRVRISAEFNGAMYQSDGQEKTVFQSDVSDDQRSLDSHFLFNRGFVREVMDSNTVDDSSSLVASFTFVPRPTFPIGYEWPLGYVTVPIAQVTTDDPANVMYEFSLDVWGQPTPVVLRGWLVPEPQCVTLAALGLAALTGSRRLRVRTR
ncbi:hypothetical protein Pla108_13740 [Botrimarina colliarenosi]|uniref:Uncharacterized protein n=1 Tax=Botrimarina colliarenosi TaxID=2528001 RepID=A0A5C6AK63_9BACT|nr:hypothetical protein [Botrimarina colliarenosi]TWU00423.1 hypothetical protein Pla108_13740 [Botrimarina colliarenosi]